MISLHRAFCGCIVCGFYDIIVVCWDGYRLAWRAACQQYVYLFSYVFNMTSTANYWRSQHSNKQTTISSEALRSLWGEHDRCLRLLRHLFDHTVCSDNDLTTLMTRAQSSRSLFCRCVWPFLAKFRAPVKMPISMKVLLSLLLLRCSIFLLHWLDVILFEANANISLILLWVTVAFLYSTGHWVFPWSCRSHMHVACVFWR